MTSLIVIFVMCVIVMFLGIWAYSNKEDTAYDKLLAQMAINKADANTKIKELENLLTSNIGTVASANLRIKDLEEQFAVVCKEAKEATEECDKLQQHCAKLQQSQIELQNILSKKRTVIKPSGPIVVEFYTNDKPKTPKPLLPKNDTPPPLPPKKRGLGKGVKSVINEQQSRKSN